MNKVVFIAIVATLFSNGYAYRLEKKTGQLYLLDVGAGATLNGIASMCQIGDGTTEGQTNCIDEPITQFDGVFTHNDPNSNSFGTLTSGANSASDGVTYFGTGPTESNNEILIGDFDGNLFTARLAVTDAGVNYFLSVEADFSSENPSTQIKTLDELYDEANTDYQSIPFDSASAPAPAPAPATCGITPEPPVGTVGDNGACCQDSHCITGLNCTQIDPEIGVGECKPTAAPAPAPVGESPSAAPATCPADFTCGADESVKTGAECVGETCQAVDCCETNELCSATSAFTCDFGHTVSSSTYCAGTTCDSNDKAACCDAHATCSTYTCDLNSSPDSAEANTPCASLVCDSNDQETCCQAINQCSDQSQSICGDGGTAFGTYTGSDTTSCACICDAGYGVDGTGVCEQCSDGDQPQWNAVNDDSPCGLHTACNANEYFTYNSITDTDVCTPCGVNQFSAGGFVTTCTDKATCDSNACTSTTHVLKSNAASLYCTGASCNTVDDQGTCCQSATCVQQNVPNSDTVLPAAMQGDTATVTCDSGYTGGGSWTCDGSSYTGTACSAPNYIDGTYFNVVAAPFHPTEAKKECVQPNYVYGPDNTGSIASVSGVTSLDGNVICPDIVPYWIAPETGANSRLYFNLDSSHACRPSDSGGDITKDLLDWVLNNVLPKFNEAGVFGTGGVPTFTGLNYYDKMHFTLSFPNADGTCSLVERGVAQPMWTFTMTSTGTEISSPPASCSTLLCGAGYSLKSGAASLTCAGNPCTVVDDRGTCCDELCTTKGYDNYNKVGPCACRTGRSFNSNVNRCMRSALKNETAPTATCSQTSIDEADLSSFSLADHKGATRFSATTAIQRRAERKSRRQERRDLFAAVKQLRDAAATGSLCNDDVFIDIDVWLPRKKEKLARWGAVQTVKLLSPATNDACAVELTNFDESNAFDCVHEDDGDECVVCNNGAKLAKVTLTSGENDAYTCECYDSSTWTTTAIVEETENEELVEYCVCDGHKIGVDSASGTVDFCGVTGGDNSTCTGCMDSSADNYDATATLPGACNYTNPICVEVGQKVHMGDGSMRAVEHLRPGDVLRTPEGTTTVRSTRRGGRHLSDVHDVTCGAQKGTITGNHAYHCEGEWRLPTNTHEPRALEGVTEVVAVETDNYCEDRMILEHGLEVETWDGRGINEWRPHAFENGRRLRCTLKGTWRDQVLKRMDSRT